jgi:hypothetical protein
MSLTLRPFLLSCCFVAALGISHEPMAAQPVPQVSPEGLQLQKSKDARLVYLRPGVTFDKYDRVVILDSYVEFAKDWQRDYNDDALGLQDRVSSQDMDRMKAGVAAAFKKVFTEELQKGGYQVVETAAPDVLVLRPAIFNLQVTAPDLMTANMKTVVVRSAGQMTLYLELWHSAPNTILARIMDSKADEWGGVATRTTNLGAMDDILRDWARKLVKHLDAARGKTAGS